MNVLFAASECVPFVKTGGLADVIGALPKELQAQQVSVRVILPKYAAIADHFKAAMTPVQQLTISLAWRKQYCGIERLEHDGIIYYFLDNEHYFRRDSLYGYGDEAERFAFYCRAVLEALPHLDFQPDIIHCHDWQSGLIPVFLQAAYRERPGYGAIRTLFTIHNLKYQGVFPRQTLRDIFDLSEDYFRPDKLEFYGNVNCMKGGLVFSDALTTVSRTYAEEIQTPYFGENLDGLLRGRSAELHGIVNGIDYSLYDPMRDSALTVPYRDSLPKKSKNKLALQRETGLPEREDAPLIAMVTRLVQQKGLDLIASVLDELLSGSDAQWIVLGTGEEKYEQMFAEAAQRYPDKVSVHLAFSDELARRIYAGSDLFLMPSQFEPCGIGQLLAFRYRSVPIVRETGGLKDTVAPYNEFTGEGVGFTFAHYNAHDMMHTIRRAIGFYGQEEQWGRLHANIRKLDFSWKSSAKQYAARYSQLLED